VIPITVPGDGPFATTALKRGEPPAFVAADGVRGSASAGRGALPPKRPDRHELKSAFGGVKKNFQNLADWPVTAGRVRR
jgi:hypothetical protein